MSLRSLVAASALFAVLAVPASAKEWTEVTIALEGAYAPWNLTDANGKIVGFEPDLTKSQPDTRRHGKAAQKQRAKQRALGNKGGRGRR